MSRIVTLQSTPQLRDGAVWVSVDGLRWRLDAPVPPAELYDQLGPRAELTVERAGDGVLRLVALRGDAEAWTLADIIGE